MLHGMPMTMCLRWTSNSNGGGTAPPPVQAGVALLHRGDERVEALVVAPAEGQEATEPADLRPRLLERQRAVNGPHDQVEGHRSTGSNMQSSWSWARMGRDALPRVRRQYRPPTPFAPGNVPRVPARATPCAGVRTMSRSGGTATGGPPCVRHRHMSTRLRAIALLASAAILAGCSAGPVSQATTLPVSGAPGAGDRHPPRPSRAPVHRHPPRPPRSQPRAAAPTSPPAPTGVPPKPGNPTWTLTKETPTADGVTVEHEVSWTEPDGAASGFLVYGVTECLRDAKKNHGNPCLVKGMKIPRTALSCSAARRATPARCPCRGKPASRSGALPVHPDASLQLLRRQHLHDRPHRGRLLPVHVLSELARPLGG